MPRFRFVGTEETREDMVRGTEGEFEKKFLESRVSWKVENEEVKKSKMLL